MKIVIALVAGLALAVACAKKKEESTTSTNFATTVVSNMGTVSANMTPASLAKASASTLAENVCAGKNGLVDCQPEFLKLYLKTSKEQLESVTKIVGDVGTALGQLADGASGTFTAENGRTGTYTKTNSENFTFSIASGATTLAYVSVSGGNYLVEIDFGGMGETAGGKFSAQVAYTDAGTFAMTVKYTGANCKTDDVRAPQNILLKVSKANGLWTGKAMIYSPRWAQFNPDPTCNDAVVDAKTFNMYSDFVADATVAKMSVYVGNSTRTDISTHGVGAFCTEYPTLCNGSGVFVNETPANYSNPACIVAATGAATWGSNCSSTSGGSVVAGANYGAASDWIQPNLFKTETTSVGP